MDLRQLLTDFYRATREDGRLGPTHMALYTTLLHRWTLQGGTHPVVVGRADLMKAVKIRSRSTYHKCLRELHRYGYLTYTPSCHPAVGSTVSLHSL